MLKFIEENKIVMILQIITSEQEYVFCFQPLNDKYDLCLDQKDQAVNIRQRHKIYTGYLKVGYFNDVNDVSNFFIYQKDCQHFYNSVLKNNLDILRIKVYIINLEYIEEDFFKEYESEKYLLNISLDKYNEFLVFDSNGRSISPSSFYSNIFKRNIFTGFVFYLDASSEESGTESPDRRMRWIL